MGNYDLKLSNHTFSCRISNPETRMFKSIRHNDSSTTSMQPLQLNQYGFHFWEQNRSISSRQVEGKYKGQLRKLIPLNFQWLSSAKIPKQLSTESSSTRIRHLKFFSNKIYQLTVYSEQDWTERNVKRPRACSWIHFMISSVFYSKFQVSIGFFFFFWKIIKNVTKFAIYRSYTLKENYFYKTLNNVLSG